MPSRPLLAFAAALVAVALALLLWSRTPAPVRELPPPPPTPPRSSPARVGAPSPRRLPPAAAPTTAAEPDEVPPPADATDAGRPRLTALAATWYPSAPSDGDVGYRGVLLDADGRPLARAVVTVSRRIGLPSTLFAGGRWTPPRTSFPLPPLRITTDDDGGFFVSTSDVSPAAGEDSSATTITFRWSPGDAPDQTSTRNVRRPPEAGGADLGAVRLQTVPLLLAVRVLDDRGPLAGSRIYVRAPGREEAPAESLGVTDADGRLVAWRNGAGDAPWQLLVNADDHLGWRGTFRPGESRHVFLDPGQEFHGILELSPATRREWYRLYVDVPDRGRFGPAWPAADGGFVFTGLPEGEATLVLHRRRGDEGLDVATWPVRIGRDGRAAPFPADARALRPDG